jgi:hypothetical protein
MQAKEFSTEQDQRTHEPKPQQHETRHCAHPIRQRTADIFPSSAALVREY